MCCYLYCVGMDIHFTRILLGINSALNGSFLSSDHIGSHNLLHQYIFLYTLTWYVQSLLCSHHCVLPYLFTYFPLTSPAETTMSQFIYV